MKTKEVGGLRCTAILSMLWVLVSRLFSNELNPCGCIAQLRNQSPAVSRTQSTSSRPPPVAQKQTSQQSPANLKVADKLKNGEPIC
eukprot:3217766-Amphidinium_carterae.1